MSNQIDTALVQGYKNNITVKFQQTTSRLEPYVRVETQNSEFDFYDRIGPTDAVKVTTRHADTPLIETDHDRRRVGLEDYDWADLIDRKDLTRMLSNPTSAYVVNAVSALNRAKDDALIQASFDTAYTGKTGSTAVTFPAGNVIAVDYVESGGAANSNLTIAKLRQVRYKLDKNEAANEGEDDLVAVVDPSQLKSLLAKTEVTSADYNTVKALVDGKVDSFMGFKFIKSNRLKTDASGYRKALFFERQGMLLSMGQDIMVDVGPRRDKRLSTQVYVCGTFGAVRMWEEKVWQVLCDETVV